MSEADRKRLKAIQTFPALVKYLREDLRWPVEQDNFDDIDDLTFDWDAKELGIDPKQAAKIEYVKQLRPLENGQPQGVFFVKFDTRQLPVVAMRKLLQTLVVKKRASAKGADRPMWEMRNLVFISSYGESTARQLSFAYFQEPESKDERPALKVLGWDEQDTPLSLDKVHDLLESHLTWPKTPKDLPAWRAGWSAAFQIGHGETVRTAKDLAERLAVLARRIRERAKRLLKIETETGPLRSLMTAFKKALIHDLTEEQFADMYAQTIAYGLLSARITHPDPLKAETLPDLIPVTNPFLKELMETFVAAGGKHRGPKKAHHIDFDELGINDVVELLRRANMDAVLRDFGAKDRKEDPVLYFYEGFAKAYDPAERIRRGEFYTPLPVVSYIVRSVHEALQTEFGIEDGLASTITWGEMAKRHNHLQIPQGVPADSPFVQILDPATGTGTFLVEVIDVILTTLQARWDREGLAHESRADAWNAYVAKSLLPRLHGYELKMAPYAIAHVKIGLKLFATGYRFGGSERARIYLTNALEPATDASNSQTDALSEALAHEVEAVNAVKRQQQFTVVIGNPPYAGHSSNNEIKFIVDLVKDYTKDEPSLRGPGQGKWLQDDYVKFLRLGQRLLAPTRVAVLGMITNHRYLTNRTFKGMRRIWMIQFPFGRILDLHGNAVVHEVSPVGHDENVFDIEQGVAIGIFIKGGTSPSSIQYQELWGPRTTAARTGKYDLLETTSVTTTRWDALHPTAPDWLFSPRQEIAEDVRAEYEQAIKLPELMPGALGPNGKPQSGLATMHDAFAISFTAAEVEQKIQRFVRTASREEAKQIFGTLCNPQQWDYASAKRRLSSSAWRSKRTHIWFSPFDCRYTVYDNSVAVHLRRRLSDHFFNHENIGLVIGESGQELSGDDWDAVSCVNSILQLNYFRRNGSPTLPLYLYEDDLLTGMRGGRRANLSAPHLRQIADRLHLGVGEDGLPIGVTAEQILHYVYAVLHSPSYRSRYSEFLKIDFPRLPLPGNLRMFRELNRLGGDLTALHLMDSPKLNDFITTYTGPKHPEVGRVGWSDDTVWLDGEATRNGQPAGRGTIGFKGVPEAVWNFHIGGYQVCEKWLKDRKGRKLLKTDIEHYQKIVVALSETIRIMKEIDGVIDRHGGWPGAFSTRPTDEIAEVRMAAEPPAPRYRR